MAFSLSKTTSQAETAMREQLAVVQRALASLGRSVSRSGTEAVHDTRDNALELYEEAYDRIAAAMPGLKKQARGATRLMRKHPTATVATVGLIVAGLTVALLVSRRAEAERDED